MRMPFGKHRGNNLADIPYDYLLWLVDNIFDMDPDLEEAVGDEIRNRDERRANRNRTHSAPPNTGRFIQLPASVKREHLRELVSAGRRTMAGKHHPDRGGQLATMQAFNIAADFLESLIETL